ncbi:TetR/AcrR family transcriptional regulator [Nocardia arthritidis]|uniref:TetR family transcriptional regulator n=1 Tax=Nocardia arthritidis TaxID=228602 RepID=A0A6G9YGV2_9NOCA|nr:TetR/AcrR family transcriptional regulator [Nocardia arthritidis]QIS12469.1 TetR family transcriptional regulator [Nocardia arthritidis]
MTESAPLAASSARAQGPGRVAQRRRTRKAIVDATMRLLARGDNPSIAEIAEAADVARRTVYLHFPTLDQLLLDATVGLVSVGADEALGRVGSDDPRVRIAALVDTLARNIGDSLPMGRRLVKLTVDAPESAESRPRRGYRRVRWIEWALEPLREQLSHNAFEDLVSQVALVVGWEAFIVLTDVRGLTPEAAARLCTDAATALIDAAVPRGT